VYRFRSQRSVPPGGLYFYETPDTGVVLQAFSKTELCDAVRGHYAENGVPPPSRRDLVALVEDFMCRRLPAGFCWGSGPRERVLTLGQLRSATHDAVRAARGRVSPGVVERRMVVCGNCGSNDRAACPSCVGLTEWALRLVGAVSRKPMDDWLGICAVDGVVLSAKVRLDYESPTGDHPQQCWLGEAGDG